MGEGSRISWTDHTFNPWWGCTRVSPGCQNCYAEAFAKRTGHQVWGRGADRRFFGEKHWAEPIKWDRDAVAAGRPALVFCASMADVFEDHLMALDDERERLWETIGCTPNLIWLLLTKRPQNVRPMVPPSWLITWPSNVWVGTTAEDSTRAAERIPYLATIPAPVRFLSCEPLLDWVTLDAYLHLEWMESLDDPASRELWGHDEGGWGREMLAYMAGARPAVDWVIVGGESGPRHRPFDPLWARALAEQCRAAEIPFFFKQHGGRTPTAGGDLLDGRQHHAWPAAAGDRS